MTGSRWQLLLLALINAATIFGRSSVSPFQEALTVARHLSDNQMALIQGAAIALPQVIAGIPLGLAVDRYSRMRLLIVFSVLTCVGTAVTAWAGDFSALFAARCLVGLATAVVGPAALSLIGDLFAPARRGRAVMVFHVGGIAGMSLAFAAGGLLLEQFGAADHGLRLAMLWFAVGTAVPLLPTVLAREPARTEVAPTDGPSRGRFAALWHHRRILVILITGWCLVQVGDAAVLVWAPPTLVRCFGLSPAKASSLMAPLLLCSGVISPFLGGIAADWCHRRAGPRLTVTALGVFALVTLAMSLFPLVSSIMLASAMLLCFITFGLAVSTMTMALSIVVIPNELRGLCIGLYTMFGAIFGLGVAPLMVSSLTQFLGGGVMIAPSLATVNAVTALLGAVAFFHARRLFTYSTRETSQ